jgi:hypothetical protein
MPTGRMNYVVAFPRNRMGQYGRDRNDRSSNRDTVPNALGFPLSDPCR